MGSTISSVSAAAAGLMEREWEFADEDDPNQHERLAKRWMEMWERKGCGTRGPRTEKDIVLHVLSALHHYNSNNPGARFDLVTPLRCNGAGFRDERWFHVNFLARPREKRNFLARRKNALPDTAVEYFFAELRYGCFDTPVVETCTILDYPLDRFKEKCAFCKSIFGIRHPSNGEFVCGRSGQKKEYYQISMRGKIPKEDNLLPEEEATSVQRLFDELPLAA